jgi:type IV secretory pathway TrbL component
MNIPIWSIIVALIIVALLLWVNETLVSDAMIQKVVRVVLVVLFVLYIVGLLTGQGPNVTFR